VLGIKPRAFPFGFPQCPYSFLKRKKRNQSYCLCLDTFVPCFSFSFFFLVWHFLMPPSSLQKDDLH
jgi:hypothetical protein